MVLAQNITIDGRFSPAQALVGPNYSITAGLGKQVGSNLFHSFGQFGLATGESAAFSGPPTINNVIGRVTSGNRSAIDGKIQSNIVGANLYLINPSGIVFGPNAMVSVSGSFHASTADYLKMSDGAKFQATNPETSTLSAAPPASFGFLTARPAAITVNGSTLGPVPGTLGVVAGPVSIVGATLSAPVGTIHMTSAAGSGEIPVDPRNTAGSTVTSFGPVDIKGGSTLDVSDPKTLGSGGSVFIRAGALTIDASEINADNYGSGAGGKLILRGDSQLALTNGGNVHSFAQASGSGAAIILRSTTGTLTADNSIVAVGSNSSGNSGKLVVSGGQVVLTNGAQLTSIAQSTGDGGPIAIKANDLLIADSATNVTSTTAGAGLTDTNGNAVPAGIGGAIALKAQNLTIRNGANVVAQSLGDGPGGAVEITAGSLLADGGGALNLSTGIFSDTSGAGSGGSIRLVAGELTLLNGANVLACASGVPACTGTLPQGSAAGGDLAVSVSGPLTLVSGASLGTIAYANGNAGNVAVTAGPVAIDMTVGRGPSYLTGIGSLTVGAGNAGNVSVTAPTLAITNNGVIVSATAGAGNGGDVSVKISGALVVNNTSGDPQFATGIIANSEPETSGNAGNVTVTAGTLSLASNGVISSGTNGTGTGGTVIVDVADLLSIDDTGGTPAASLTGIDSSTTHAGDAGNVTISAGRLSITHNGQISGITFGAGKGGNVVVGVTGGLSIDGTGGDPAFLTGISSQTESTGDGGRVAVTAGRLSMSDGGQIQSVTFTAGNGGQVSVATLGDVFINGSGGPVPTGILSSTKPESTGQAGRVVLAAGGAIALAGGAQVTSGTAGAGDGGTVLVTAQGWLRLSDPDTGITASAASTASGNAGSVIVSADSLTVQGGAQIASSTAGPGKGGDVNITVASDIVLPDPGPQITAQSTGSGDAGSITLSAARLLMNDRAAILTEAATSTANGGNITLHLRDFLYLVSSEISTSVKGETGNGGNIAIDPQLVILNHSSIIAEAIEGHGGDITITAGQFIPSTDSIVSATSELGISGTIVINGPRVDVNGALVVLSTQLRGRTELLREACAARADRPISSLVEAGRGGLPTDPEATLPALYIAGRDLSPNPQTRGDRAELSSAPVHTTAHLTMHCG
jgi:filamentous hemagglutinin family protein